ncbi:hypothetical protein BDV98DRAFT_569824 [Pterulicium gracile]|uniref:Uncharacterized protein n=1 Tax=Pterulicium gracile TaxID=1884261 RepID=A0A5C3QD90_9AGAR|nr:hypothetical protein BDV98DRAFT_569824 [Pterula gracilis]
MYKVLYWLLNLDRDAVEQIGSAGQEAVVVPQCMRLRYKGRHPHRMYCPVGIPHPAHPWAA